MASASGRPWLAWQRTLTGNPATVGIVVIAALGLAALIPALRIPVLSGMCVGLLLSAGGRAPRWRWAFAAGVPVALLLAWSRFVHDRLLEGPYACADLLSPVAWQRVLEAVVVIGAVVLLVRFLGTSLGALGLGRPSRNEVILGVAAILLVPLPSLYIGAILAEPFFGEMDLDLGQPAAIVPALVLAVANGTMEELVYRGALMAWLSRAAGPLVGLLGQAAIFGLAHTGPDFTGPALPVVLAIMAAGLVAGLIVRRTGSLWFVIAAHIAFDVPLYYAAACRLG